MDIAKLLSTKERVRLLGYILSRPSMEIVPDRLAGEAGASRSQAHKYVNILRGEGIVRGRRLVDSPILQQIHALLNLKKMEDAGVGGILRRRFRKIRGWGIFGSWAAGANAERSDLDIWVKLEQEPADLGIARARKEISRKLGVPVDIVAATPQRLESLQEKSEAFYYSLYCGRVMGGEGL